VGAVGFFSVEGVIGCFVSSGFLTGRDSPRGTTRAGVYLGFEGQFAKARPNLDSAPGSNTIRLPGEMRDRARLLPDRRSFFGE
jgi:hypothetical protein